MVNLRGGGNTTYGQQKRAKRKRGSTRSVESRRRGRYPTVGHGPRSG
jgi:hypothetical protein